MDDIDFDQPALVLWFPKNAGYDRGDSRQFGSLAKAVQFVMDGIPEHVRGTARINTDSGSFDIEQIEAMYRVLNP
jgi:hypothetical protein